MLSVFLQDGVLASFLLHKEKEDAIQVDYSLLLAEIKDISETLHFEITQLNLRLGTFKTLTTNAELLQSMQSLNQTIIKFTHRTEIYTEIYKAVYDYTANDNDELSFVENDLFTNVVIIESGWAQVCVFYILFK